MARTSSHAPLRWWLIGSAGLVIALGVAAAVFIPRYLHAQRVAEYQETVHSISQTLAELHDAEIATDEAMLVYALQLPDARELRDILTELAEYSDHYFTSTQLEQFAQVADDLTVTLRDGLFQPHATAVLGRAQHASMMQGTALPTHPLRLDPLDAQALLPAREAATHAPVADAEVTTDTVAQAQQLLTDLTEDLAAAHDARASAQERADSLIDAVGETLEPLSEAALAAPEQAETVLDMYPDANEEIVEQLRISAKRAHDTVTAEQFALTDGAIPLPVVDDGSADDASHTATQAWRAHVIAAHLTSYTDAITSAWITDAGSLEDALGFNPYLPFG